MKRIVFVHEGVRDAGTEEERNHREAYDTVIRAFVRTIAGNRPQRADEREVFHIEYAGVESACERGLADVLVFMSAERRKDAERLKRTYLALRIIVLTVEDPGDRNVIVANKLWKFGPEGWRSVILGE